MTSLREQARALRRAGLSLQEISERLHHRVPRSTLQGWVRDIPLTLDQQARLRQRIREGGRKGRLRAQMLREERKRQEQEDLRRKAKELIQDAPEQVIALLIALGLYLGEGAKARDSFCLGNSDPRIICLWQECLRRSFEIDQDRWAAQLMLSDGMDEEVVRSFWSEITGIPISRFHRSSFRRGKPRKIRSGYKGVCLVHYFDLKIRRFLDALFDVILEQFGISVGP